MTESPLTLTIAGGVTIVVPDDLDDASTDVFLEQEDGFGDEVAFVRRVALGDRDGEIGFQRGASRG